jgi:sugar-phosphatase
MKRSIEVVIFDMDGLIIDSEPLWRKAEIEAFKEIGFHFTEQMCIQTMGMRIDQVVHYWWNKLKWGTPSESDVVNSIQSKMIDLIQKEGVLLPGVLDSLKLLKENNIPIALASSSAMILINTVIDTLDIKSYFNVIHSAENEPAGKPDPSVFLSTAKSLNTKPSKCLVLEDSKAGMEAGLNATMRTILIPEKGSCPEWKDKAFKVLNSMEDFTLTLLF